MPHAATASEPRARSPTQAALRHTVVAIVSFDDLSGRMVPHAIAVSVGDDPADFADTLVLWSLDSPDDSDEPPREWFA